MENSWSEQLIETKNTSGGERIYNITGKGLEFLANFYELKKHAEIAESKKRTLQSALTQK
jgi:predicted transcriptional regulator